MNNLAHISSLPQLIFKVFHRLEEKNRILPKQQRELSYDDLHELFGIFGEVLERALDLIDREQIKLYLPTKRDRQLLEIAGQNGAVYRFFPNINYCPCKVFKHSVLATRTEYTCKHVLAAKLANILDRCTEVVISDSGFNYIIAGLAHECTNCAVLACDEP